MRVTTNTKLIKRRAKFGTYASLDDSKVITVKFAVPVTTIFIVERGGNDSGVAEDPRCRGHD